MIQRSLFEQHDPVAALYVEPGGPYFDLADVDCWDESRDARLYDGPYPIVAHPDCGPWGKLRHLYQGTGHDCAPRAVEQVREWGGVLEHPATSRLWPALGLPRPDEQRTRDGSGGWTENVFQVDWGHVARKQTWLYCVRVDAGLAASRPPPGEPTHWITAFREKPGGKKLRDGACPPGIKICSAEQRRRTPRLFAEWLVSLARSVSERPS